MEKLVGFMICFFAFCIVFCIVFSYIKKMLCEILDFDISYIEKLPIWLAYLIVFILSVIYVLKVDYEESIFVSSSILALLDSLVLSFSHN